MSVKKALSQKANNNIEKQQGKNIRQLIQAMKGEIEKALPSVLTPERFTRMALTAISSNPKLQECTQESFLGALMNAAQLGLEPNTPLGQAYLIPFRNKGKMECQFQIGYKGLIDLAHRSGEFKNINAQVVYENDEFEYELGLESSLKHKPVMSNRGEPIAYYAIYKLVNGGYGFEVMSIEDVKKHGQAYSQSFNSSYSPWNKNFDEMAKKTVLKKVLKYAPIKTDFARGIAQDSTIKTDIKDEMSEVEDKMDWDSIDAEYSEGENEEDLDIPDELAEAPID